MVPGVDALNDASGRAAPGTTLKIGACFEMVAERSICKGEEVTHSYDDVVDAADYQVWAKPLGGATAALVFNRGAATLDVSVPLAALGLPETATARDVWTHTNATVSVAWTATLPPHDSAFAVFSS